MGKERERGRIHHPRNASGSPTAFIIIIDSYSFLSYLCRCGESAAFPRGKTEKEERRRRRKGPTKLTFIFGLHFFHVDMGKGDLWNFSLPLDRRIERRPPPPLPRRDNNPPSFLLHLPPLSERESCFLEAEAEAEDAPW